jgi:hypothetical protein
VPQPAQLYIDCRPTGTRYLSAAALTVRARRKLDTPDPHPVTASEDRTTAALPTLSA